MVRVALVGIGGYGKRLTEVLLSAERDGLCRLVAAADARLDSLPAERDDLTRRGVKLYADAIGMFTALEGSCEAVYIATSIHSHKPLACAAAARGLNIHLEKPPAATVQDVDDIRCAVDRAAVRCAVGFQQAWSGGIRLIKRRVAEGKLGRLRSIACHAGWPRNRAYYARNDWAGRLKLGERWVLDGPTTNALAHQVMNLLFLGCADLDGCARPTAVRGELYAAGSVESHDTAAIEIHTDAGTPLYFFGSHCSETMFGPVIDIDAERARAFWNGRCAEIHYDDGTRESSEQEGDLQFRTAMVRQCLKAFSGGEPSSLRCSLSDARNMVLAINGAHDSSGRVHRIDGRYLSPSREAAGSSGTVIAGIDALLVRSAEGRQLFSDVQDAQEWAVHTEPYNLSDCYTFPQQFVI